MVWYIANIRLPTKKAHGRTIVNTCAGLAALGHHVRLCVPKRRNHETPQNPFQYYGVPDVFSLCRYMSIDVFFLERYLGKSAYWIQAMSFYVGIFLRFLFRSRKETCVYTRDILGAALGYIGYKVIWEVHSLPHNPTRARWVYLLGRKVQHIIVISHGLKQQLAGAGVDASRIHVLPSGVDMAIFDTKLSVAEAKQTQGLAEQPFVLGYMGRFRTMGEGKGVEYVIRLLSACRAPYYFLAVGATDTERQEAEAFAAAYGVAPQVRCVSFVSQEELASYMQACDAFVMPYPNTPHYATHMSPVKMFEYMAAHRPIIAPRLPSITSILSDNECYLYDPDDDESFLKAVNECQQHPTDRARKADQAYALVQTYTYEQRNAKIATLIRQL